MRAKGLWALLYLFAPSAWAVSGTNWSVSAPEQWTPAETQSLQRLAASMPEALKQIPGGLRLDRVEGVERLEERHPLVRVAWDGSRLQILEGALTKDAGAQALVHGLVHVADSHAHWSQTDQWQLISGWNESLLGDPAERDSLTYADVRGMNSAEEDLATAAEHFVMPADQGDSGCGMRAKWRFLEDHLGQTPSQRCTALSQVGLDPETVVSLELIYAQPSTRNPGSLAGHLSLGVQYKAEPGQAARHDVYQLGAAIGRTKPGSLAYVAKGLGGGFPSVISRQPFAKLAMNYGKQNRSLTRLELKLNPDQKLRLLERLDDVRQGWDRSYLFLTRNCTYLPQTLMEWALGESLGLPAVAGPDVFLGILERRGLIVPRPASSIYEFTQLRQAQEARALTDTVVARLLKAHATDDGALDAIAGQLRHSRESVRVEGIMALAALSPTLLDAHPEVHPDLIRILVWAEESERLTQARSRGKRGADGLAAIWKAQAAVQAAASNQGLPSIGTADAEARLLAALLMRQTGPQGRPVGRIQVAERSHTSLKRVDILGGAQWGAASAVPSVLFRSTWYRYRLGEARRYAFGEGVDLTGLALKWRLDFTEMPAHKVELLPIRLLWVTGHRRVLNPGVYVSLLHTHREQAAHRRVRVDGIEAGVPLELWQHDKHRLHVGVSGGLSVGVEGQGESTLSMQWQRTLAAPTRLFMRAGSAKEPLNALSLAAVWRPSLLSDATREELSAEIDGGARIGALWGADVALVGAYELAPPVSQHALDWAAASHRLTVGLAMERY